MEIKPYESDYIVTQRDYDPEFMKQEFDVGRQANIILCGQTMSGKTTLLQNLFVRRWLHEYDPKNVYIFSNTASMDMAYKPVLVYLYEQGQVLNLQSSIDMDKISDIVERQMEIG